MDCVLPWYLQMTGPGRRNKTITKYFLDILKLTKHAMFTSKEKPFSMLSYCIKCPQCGHYCKTTRGNCCMIDLELLHHIQGLLIKKSWAYAKQNKTKTKPDAIRYLFGLLQLNSVVHVSGFRHPRVWILHVSVCGWGTPYQVYDNTLPVDFQLLFFILVLPHLV